MPTVSYSIANTADDAVSLPGFADTNTGVAFGDLSALSPGLKAVGALRFLDVELSATDTITAASVTITRHPGGPLTNGTGFTGAEAGLVRGVAVANQAALPVDLTTLPKTSAAATITTGASVVIDVLAVVQAIQALPGWASGNAMAFVGDPSSTTGFLEVYDYNSDPAKSAVLSITYEASGPDETAPTITSSVAPSVVEGAALSHALTANETVTWTKVGGVNAAAFTLTGSTLWLPAQTYPSGPFEVIVRATDAAGNWTEQTITVSITAAPPISFIGSATGTTTAAMPLHQAGDLILCWAYRDGSNTLPTLPSAGWTSLVGATGANTNSARLVGKIATSSSEAVGTFTSATSVVVTVYRPKAGYSLSFGAVAATTGAASSFSYPALVLQNTDGSSWVAGFAGHRSTNTAIETPPAGMINRATVLDATDEAAAHDTDGGVSAWSSQPVSIGGTASGWRTAVVEIKVTAPVTARATFQAFIIG